jgi:hypothetical protein
MLTKFDIEHFCFVDYCLTLTAMCDFWLVDELPYVVLATKFFLICSVHQYDFGLTLLLLTHSNSNRITV